MGTCCRFNSGKNINGSFIPFLYSTIGGRDDYFELKFRKSIGLRLIMHEFDLSPQIEFFNIHETVISLSNNSKFNFVIDITKDNLTDYFTFKGCNYSIIPSLKNSIDPNTLPSYQSSCFISDLL